jgi:DNA-binding NarL/FixJ family response regulator
MGVMTTILIVDDHPDFRTEARRLLEREGFTVIGEAGSAADAQATAVALDPDVVLLDIGLPDGDGFEVAAGLRRAGLTAAIVLTSSRDASTYGPLLSDAPVDGFIPKDELSGQAIAALIAA